MPGKGPTILAEPAVPAEAAQSVDPALVRRLWRPVERPGVIDPGPARAMLARHQRMVAGLPLAELVARHIGAISDLDGATVPIVYALPSQPPPLPTSRPSDAQFNVAGSGPIVSARPAQQSARLSQPPPGPAQSASMQAAPGSSIPLSVSPVVSVPHDTVASLVVPRAPFSDPRSVDRLPLELHTPDPGSSDTGIGSIDPEQSAAGHGQSMVGTAQPAVEVARSVQTAPGQPAPVQAAPGSSHLPSVFPTLAAIDNATASQVVHPQAAVPLGLRSPSVVSPPDADATDSRPASSGPQRPSAPASSQPVVPAGIVRAELGSAPRSIPDGGSETPIVVAARPAARVAVQPHVRPEQPLLLVDLEAATSRPGRNRPVTAGHRESGAGVGRTPGAGRLSGAAQAVGAPHIADRAAQEQAQARRQVTAPVDVERIVDAVHRRFVRRLAIEAERRAVR